MARTNPVEFVRQVRQEASKVTWPTRKETGVATAMVFVMVTLAALFFFVVDQGLALAVRNILGLGGEAMTVEWYVAHVHSGFEKRVAESIRERTEREDIGHLIEDVIVPTEEVHEVRRGSRITSERKFFPGYVLIRMELTDHSWHLVKNTPKVSGFLGGGGNRPMPITAAEANRILYQVHEGVERPRPSVVYSVGEEVRVADGPFTSFTGAVEEVDEGRARLKVSVSIFGRPTPVELEYSQVEKV